MTIDELGRCTTRSGNAYFDNNEQALLAVFTAVFCFTHAEYNLIKGGLSGLRQFLATESPLKMKKNVFYFTSKALFVLKILRFMS